MWYNSVSSEIDIHLLWISYWLPLYFLQVILNGSIKWSRCFTNLIINHRSLTRITKSPTVPPSRVEIMAHGMASNETLLPSLTIVYVDDTMLKTTWTSRNKRNFNWFHVDVILSQHLTGLPYRSYALQVVQMNWILIELICRVAGETISRDWWRGQKEKNIPGTKSFEFEFLENFLIMFVTEQIFQIEFYW